MPDSIDEEFAGATLKDSRLTKRLVALASSMSLEPAASFPRALDESALEAAYRFLGNKKVKPQLVLQPHVSKTLERISDAPVTLALHDTTTLSFRHEGKRRGFGALSEKSQQLWTHATLAVSSDGTRRPDGLLAITTDAVMDHDRWYRHVADTNALFADAGRLVHIMDREADDYVLFAKLVSVGARFIIRLQHDRKIVGIDTPAKISAALSRAELVVQREVMLSARGTPRGSKQRRVHPARSGRLAALSIAAVSIDVRRPRDRARGTPASLAVNVVRVWEAAPPPGEAAVEWLLLTTEPIESADEMLRVVDWYRTRWVIEEFFKALKTGCAIEKRQLETFTAMGNAVALLSPIAWQLLLLRHRARNDGEADGASSLPAAMFSVLGHLARRPLTEKPTAREVFLAVAALGGHLRRNGAPGWQTLAHGYEKLRDATAIWELALAAARCDQS